MLKKCACWRGNHERTCYYCTNSNKKSISLGNIYDLILADFYTKVRKHVGVDVENIMLWNVNGKIIEKIENIPKGGAVKKKRYIWQFLI